MNTPGPGQQAPDPELMKLIELYCDGLASTDDVARLEARLRVDAAARWAYIAYLDLHAESQLTHRTDATTPITGEPAGPSSHHLRIFSLHRRPMRYALAASLILCVGVVASVMNMISVQNGTTQNTGPAIATLTDTQDAIWDSDNPQSALRNPQSGSQLPGGFLRLKSGTAKVVFLSGAEVTLQGPCEFGLNSEMRGYLRQGKITAYVPERAHGFTVAGPQCAVIDLGTRFTMTVRPTGAADVRVYVGRVQVQVEAAKGNEAKSMELAVDQTAVVDGGSVTLGRVVQRPVLDVHTIPLGQLFEAEYDSDLSAALSRDTFKATANLTSLGVERLAMGGVARRNIGGDIEFDFASAGWTGATYGSIANAAFTGEAGASAAIAGGIRTTGKPHTIMNFPRTEPGIGMHADATITFDLDQIRRAGPLAAVPMRFRCDRAGINDSTIGQAAMPVHTVVLVSDDKGVIAGYVDGVAVTVAEQNGVWRFVGQLPVPFNYGQYAAYDVALPENAHHLTLITTGPHGIGVAHTVFSGARLDLP